MHAPPKPAVVLDCMSALFDQLREEAHQAVRAVRAVLGNWISPCIHPNLDVNGRVGRFLMNATLASGGYSWTIIRVDRRIEYMAALEEASIRKNIRPSVEFLVDSMPQTAHNG